MSYFDLPELQSPNALASLVNGKVTEEKWIELTLQRLKDIDLFRKHLFYTELIDYHFSRRPYNPTGKGTFRSDDPTMTIEAEIGSDVLVIIPLQKDWRIMNDCVHSAFIEPEGPVIPTLYQFWGISRERGMCPSPHEKWLGIAVYTVIPQEPKRLGHVYGIEIVKEILVKEISLTDLPQFCKHSTREIWENINRAIKDWARHSLFQYEVSQRLFRTICAEEEVSKHLQDNSVSIPSLPSS